RCPKRGASSDRSGGRRTARRAGAREAEGAQIDRWRGGAAESRRSVAGDPGGRQPGYRGGSTVQDGGNSQRCSGDPTARAYLQAGMSGRLAAGRRGQLRTRGMVRGPGEWSGSFRGRNYCETETGNGGSGALRLFSGGARIRLFARLTASGSAQVLSQWAPCRDNLIW